MTWMDEIRKETPEDEDIIKVDSEMEGLMKNWNQTIAKIQDMLDSLKTHPVFEDGGREIINQDIDSIKGRIAKELTFNVGV